MKTKVLMSNKEYHANEGVGSTLLKAIHGKSVIHAIETPFEENDSSIMGGGLHSKVLTPEDFNSEYMVAPKIDKRTKAGKEAFAKLEIEAQGKSILKPEQMEAIEQMAASISAHPKAKNMLVGGEAEFSYFTRCKETDLLLKCRPDYVNQGALIDVKTARDASPQGFAKAVANFGYHIQAAYYLDVFNQATGGNAKEFYFVVVENSAPYAAATYKLDGLAIEHGRKLYQEALRKLASYYKAMSEPSFSKSAYMYGEEITELELPVWAYTA